MIKKQTFLSLLFVITAVINTFAATELSLNTTTITPGETATLTLNIKNAVDCAGINAKIILPEGISATGISKGTLLSASFTTAYSAFSDEQGQGIIVLAYSGFDTFKQPNGDLLKIHLKADMNATDGIHEIPFADSNLNALVNSRYAVSNADGSTSLEPSVISGQIDILPKNSTHESHFKTVWEGNPYDGMTIWLIRDSFTTLNLEPGDEIAIYDGDDCVGFSTVKSTNDDNFYIITSKANDDDPGFTTGNQILFRVWDDSEQLETNHIAGCFFDIDGNPTDNNTFSPKADIYVNLNFYSSQTINLMAGWNNFSSYVMPDSPDMLTIFQNLIAQDALYKIIDEQGQRLMYNAFSKNWNNGIGNIGYEEGYQIKVKKDVSLTITGEKAELPYEIQLSKGWNIFGWPSETPQNAINVLKNLIDNDLLIKVIDEQGKRIIYNAFSKQWVNGIEEFESGKGFLIKVKDDTSFVINEASQIKRSRNRSSVNRMLRSTNAIHCSPVWDGNPYNSLTLNIIEVEGFMIEANDEICIFEGDKCVGVGIVGQEISHDNQLEILCSQDDGTGNGFQTGNDIVFKIWDSSEDQELTTVTPYFMDMDTAEIIEPAPKYSANTDFGVKLSVISENHGPIISDINDYTMNQNTELTIPVSVYDPDGDEFTLSAQSNNENLAVDVDTDQSGIVLKPITNWFGTVTINVFATDTDGLYDEKSFRLTVIQKQEPNDCPVIPQTELTGLIQDTGQTESFRNITGVDADYLINPPSFTKLDQNGQDLPVQADKWDMVRDNVTGLIWEVKTDDNSFRDKDLMYYWYNSNPEINAGISGKADEMDTEKYTFQLNNLHPGCFTDWRMPTIHELASLINYGRQNSSTFIQFFPNMQTNNYWSSTTPVDYPEYAICINFESGQEKYKQKSNSKVYLRAVRGTEKSGQHTRFVKKDDFIIIDTHTGLMWAKPDNEQLLSFNDAISYCENLTLVTTSWRMPNINELRSLLDYTSASKPAVQSTYFSNIKSDLYWSGTQTENGAWCIDFQNRSSKDSSIYDLKYVLAVSGGQNQSPEKIVIQRPLQGTILWTGIRETIKWQPKNIDGQVKIELIREPGTIELLSAQTENDGYFNWIVTGPSTNNCMIRITPIENPSNANTQSFVSIKESYYKPVWSGNAYDSMMLRIINIDDLDLTDGSEIGIFDGDRCVGRGLVKGNVSEVYKLNIICSADDGSENGFIEGNNIIIKTWNPNSETESTNIFSEFFDLNNNPVAPTFEKLSDYNLKLSAKVSVQFVASEGGTITPSQIIFLEKGAIQKVIITPGHCYDIVDVLDNGESVGQPSSYTIQNIKENHVIEALFAIKHYTITATAGTGGSLSPSGQYFVECGSSLCISALADNDKYELSDLTIDGVSNENINRYCFEDIQNNHVISADFQKAKITQKIPLEKGWNIISFMISTDITVFNELIASNVLDKVMDESGDSIIYSLGKWQYGFNEIKSSEGYKVKVSEDVMISVTGYPCESPLEVNLKKGWNITGYPCSQNKKAFHIFKPLINNNLLVKVINKKSFRLYQANGVWNDEIVDMKSGEGYLVKTTADTSLLYPCEDMSNRRRNNVIYEKDTDNMLRKKSLKSNLAWTPVWDINQNPYNCMSIWIIDIEGYDIQQGDVIGIFDENNCVGLTTVSGEISRENPLIIKTSQDDNTGETNGFFDNKKIQIKIWTPCDTYDFNDLTTEFIDISNGNIIPDAVFRGNDDIAVRIRMNENVNLSDLVTALQVLTEIEVDSSCLSRKSDIGKTIDINDLIHIIKRLSLLNDQN